MITVFTPTYNRARLLPRLYESLCGQTYRDFEWVIVDDGSVDDTFDVINKLKVENGKLKNKHQFPIRYFYQENGGKHRAINRGVKEAEGDLFFIVDSDDFLFPYSLECVVIEYENIKNDYSFCGVSGMRGVSEDIKIGSKVNFIQLDCTISESSYKYHIYGDKAEAIRVSVLRRFPFPEFYGERFCPEALVWNRISRKYKIRYFNKIIYGCEYQVDGLTSKIAKLLENNIMSTMLTYKEMSEDINAPLWFRVRSVINYFRYTLFKSFRFNSEYRLKWYWLWLIPVGFLVRLIKG